MLNIRNLLVVLLRVVPACLVLLAAAPARADARFDQNVGATTLEGLAGPLKLAHRAPAPQRDLVALEEFGIDNDAEQYLKAVARIHCAETAYSWPDRSEKFFYRVPPRPYRRRAALPTGPPCA